MSGKKLLILERQKSNLDITTAEDGSVVLEGVFTEFDVKNKNNRIYEEKEVMPHINELQEKVWGYQSHIETHTVETHIYRLRKKILNTFNDNEFIISKKNGYQIK